MHPQIYREFETILAARNTSGSVLEIGAIAGVILGLGLG